MNKENAHSFLPIVQALGDGKTIQYQSQIGPAAEWKDISELSFTVPADFYRIKPEAREWTVRRNLVSGTISAVDGPEVNLGELFRVREILD